MPRTIRALPAFCRGLRGGQLGNIPSWRLSRFVAVGNPVSPCYVADADRLLFGCEPASAHPVWEIFFHFERLQNTGWRPLSLPVLASGQFHLGRCRDHPHRLHRHIRHAPGARSPVRGSTGWRMRITRRPRSALIGHSPCKPLVPSRRVRASARWRCIIRECQRGPTHRISKTAPALRIN